MLTSAKILALDSKEECKGVFSSKNSLSAMFSAEMIDKLKQINSSPRDQTGVWYYDEYADYCREQGKLFDADYQNGFASPKFWERTGRNQFKVKAGEKASEALHAFLNGFTIGDCGNMMIACQYAALLKVLGKDKFNLIFSGENALTITQTIHDLNSPLTVFFKFSESKKVKGIIGDRPLAMGDVCHVGGLRYYPVKHPAGCSGGENLIYFGKNDKNEDLFLGFGASKFGERQLTEIELYQYFVSDHNLDRNSFDLQMIAADSDPSKYDMKKKHVPEKTTLDEAFEVISGYLPDCTISPNYAKIEKYIKADISEIAAMFAEDKNLLLHGKSDTKESLSSEGRKLFSSKGPSVSPFFAVDYGDFGSFARYS